MGSLENGVLLKRTPLPRSSTLNRSSRSLFLKPRSRLARFLLFERFDYLLWIYIAAAFFFVVVLFQAFLPGSVVERREFVEGDGEAILNKVRVLEFGDGIRFEPSGLMEKWAKERRVVNASSYFGLRKARICLVLADLSANGVQLEMISVAIALKEVGYNIQVYSLKSGPVNASWRDVGIPVNIIHMDVKCEVSIDWLVYDGIIVNSLDSRPVISCLLQEPFKSIPILWSIHERTLALRLNKYAAMGQHQLIDDWKQLFNRATVVIFPTHSLPMLYSAFDAGNYFVIPSSAVETWRSFNFPLPQNEEKTRIRMGYKSNSFIIAIVGSQFSYSGMWIEYALVLQVLAAALKKLSTDEASKFVIKLGISSGNSSDTYKSALETIASKFGYPEETVQLLTCGNDEINFLSVANIVIYGSFLEEQSFPPVLSQAMSLGKLVIAPDIDMIKKSVNDKVNGFLYAKENIILLKRILFEVVSDNGLSPSAQKVAMAGKESSKNLMVSDTIKSYASLLENVIKFPSEVILPKAASNISSKLIEGWQLQLFEGYKMTNDTNRTLDNYGILDKIEEHWDRTHNEASANANVTSRMEDAFSSIAWEEEKLIEKVNARKRLEDIELRDRAGQTHRTWEEVYRITKRAERTKYELHERDERELERIGQPLCIYEPYFGEGAWRFLRNTSLYRGVGLSSKGRRRGSDDIDASSRLPLLSSGYYRDVLGEYGAFFALANRIDHIHKNAWIGFQSWRAGARKESLSKRAESAILEDIEHKRHGDALYFWARMDNDPRNSLQNDFWAFCDAINAGNCRFIVSEALKRMYGVKQPHLSMLPKMPNDGDSWSVMHSWALPTRSFLEFVMFSRMFVDALDAQMYDEHYNSGICKLSLTKDRHCYSRVLELMINVWAYHSARRMVYVNPETGSIQEHHKLKTRKGQMWVKWFSYATLKSMDEDLAEESDSDHPARRWLWPLTGEVYWQGIYEREKNMRQQQKEKRKQQSKDKIRRIKRRSRQKTIGKYVKPKGEMAGDLNSSVTH